MDFIQEELEVYTRELTRHFNQNLNRRKLAWRCPLDDGRHSTTHQQPFKSSRLEVLPLEITTMIILLLDIPTLTAFRRVSRPAMGLVDSLRQYRIVRKLCPDILRATISIGADSFDCKTLYQTLSTSKCDDCDRFGQFLYLITCKRVCYFCFTEAPQYRPVPIVQSGKQTGMSRKELKKHLPHITSLPGTYSSAYRFSRTRRILFDREAVQSRASKESSQLLNNFAKKPDRLSEEPQRFMSIILAPYLDGGNLADWGYYCKGCTRYMRPGTDFMNKFTKKGFQDHVERHGELATRKGFNGSILIYHKKRDRKSYRMSVRGFRN